LIWSAFVVGIPCGKPRYTFNVAFFTSFADNNAAAPMGHDLVIVAVHDQRGYVDLLRSSVKSVSENALMQS